MLNQGCGCLGTSGIGINNFSLLNTIVVDYRTYRFMMKKFLSKKINLGFSNIDIFRKPFQ